MENHEIISLRNELNHRIVDNLAAVMVKLRGERGTKRRLPLWGAASTIRAACFPLTYGRPSPHIVAVLDLIEAFLDRTDDNLGIMDKVRGLAGPGWSTLTDAGEYIDEVSNAGILAMQMAYLALWNKKYPYLFRIESSRIQAIFDAATRLCRHYLREIEWENGYAFMRSRIDGRIEPFNHVHTYAAACSILGHVTDDKELLRVGFNFLRTFEANVFEEGTVWWPYRPALCGEKVGRGEQIWKAITTLQLPIALSMIDSTVNTDPYVELFLKHIYCGTKENVPTFQIHIGNCKRRMLFRENIKLMERRSRVQAISEYAILNHPSIDRIICDTVEKRSDLFPDGWFGLRRSMIGLASVLERITNHQESPQSGFS